MIPLFYERGADGLPRGWIAKMKASMSRLCPIFNTNRMVMEYCNRYYIPAHQLCEKLCKDDMQGARELANWKARIREHWGEIRILSTNTNGTSSVGVGESVKVQAHVGLGTMKPDEVAVQIYSGVLNSERMIQHGDVFSMKMAKDTGNGTYLYEGTLPCSQSGLHGLSVRVIPSHPDVLNPLRLGLIKWADL